MSLVVLLLLLGEKNTHKQGEGDRMDPESMARGMAKELGEAFIKTVELGKYVQDCKKKGLLGDMMFKPLDDGLMEIGCGIIEFTNQISDLVEELAVGFEECGLGENLRGRG